MGKEKIWWYKDSNAHQGKWANLKQIEQTHPSVKLKFYFEKWGVKGMRISYDKLSLRKNVTGFSVFGGLGGGVKSLFRIGNPQYFRNTMEIRSP